MSTLVLVLDANIIIRAVLGNKIRDYLIQHCETVTFLTPDVCMEDAEKYLPQIFEKRSLPKEILKEVLDNIKPLLHVIDKSIYTEKSQEARERMQSSDIEDWPIVATALQFDCPIWTEDKDFFGVGVSTWTSSRIHIFFKSCEG